MTLEEMYKGAEKSYDIQRNEICNACSGTGAKDGKMKRCPKCKGQGQVLQNMQMGIGMTV